jgi:hypothetical protein
VSILAFFFFDRARRADEHSITSFATHTSLSPFFLSFCRFIHPSIYNHVYVLMSTIVTHGSHSHLLSLSTFVLDHYRSIMELQSILSGLIEAYEFSLPPGGLDIQEVPAGTTSPMVRGQMEKGTQMPLRVRRLSN